MSETAALSHEDIRAFEGDAKIGLLATVSPEGLPHLSLITSLQAKDPHHLMFGQFSEGLSKTYLRNNPRAGFLVMSQDKQVWRGKARWTHAATHGEDYDMYNRKPMFRYNSYFGIHTVHYLDVIDFGGREPLPVASFAVGSLVTALARRFAGRRSRGDVLKPWAKNLISKLGTLKFFSYIGTDGHPVIVPVVPCQAASSRRLVFARVPVPLATPVAILALNLQMESVLVRGRVCGYRRFAGLKAGLIDIDWVYNSMPPMQGPIYVG